MSNKQNRTYYQKEYIKANNYTTIIMRYSTTGPRTERIWRSSWKLWLNHSKLNELTSWAQSLHSVLSPNWGWVTAGTTSSVTNLQPILLGQKWKLPRPFTPTPEQLSSCTPWTTTKVFTLRLHATTNPHILKRLNMHIFTDGKSRTPKPF